MIHFESQDLAIIGLLIFLEGILSIDNALVLAILAKPLPKALQRKALTYGLVGAVIFRTVAIFMATQLIRYKWLKFAGGGYLLWISIQELFLKKEKDVNTHTPARGFWKTVLIIELTDIAFALDSILAAVALTPKIWLIITGGILGMILMRFSASLFISLLDRFPSLSNTAYFLVLLIGLKVVLEALEIPYLHFHDTSSPAFWAFWMTMAGTILYGFIPRKSRTPKDLKKTLEDMDSQHPI